MIYVRNIEVIIQERILKLFRHRILFFMTMKSTNRHAINVAMHTSTSGTPASMSAWRSMAMFTNLEANAVHCPNMAWPAIILISH